MGHLVLQKHIFCLMHWPCSVLLVLQLCTASQHHVCAMELQTLAESPPTRGTCRAAQTILIASDPSSDWGEVEKRIFECLLSPSFVKSVSINSDNKQPTAATHSLPAPLGTNTNSPPDQMEAAVSKALSSDTVLYKKKKKTSHTLNLSPPYLFFTLYNFPSSLHASIVQRRRTLAFHIKWCISVMFTSVCSVPLRLLMGLQSLACTVITTETPL